MLLFFNGFDWKFIKMRLSIWCGAWMCETKSEWRNISATYQNVYVCVCLSDCLLRKYTIRQSTTTTTAMCEWVKESPNVTQWHMKVIYPSDNDVALIQAKQTVLFGCSIFRLRSTWVCSSWEGAANLWLYAIRLSIANKCSTVMKRREREREIKLRRWFCRMVDASRHLIPHRYPFICE